MNSCPPLPHGLDDLQQGIETLLSSEPQVHRQVLAQTIMDSIGSIPGSAAQQLCLEVGRFAAWGGGENDVRAAFQRFVVDVGVWVGEKQIEHKANTKLRKASVIGAETRSKTAAQQQQIADKWFSRAWALNPHAGRVLLLIKAKQLLEADIASADKDMSRYAQAENEAGEKMALASKSRLRKEKDLLTRTRADNFLKAQKPK
jgi:hypothetical protein